MSQAEKVRKKFQSRIPFVLDPGKKNPKKIAKNSKNKKTSSGIIFSQNENEVGQKSEK